VYVQHPTEACSCKHCYWEKAVSFTYMSGCLQYPGCNAHEPCCHLWPVRLSTILKKKKSYWTQNVCFYFLNNFCLKHFSFKEELSEIRSQIYTGLQVKYPLSCQILMKLEYSWQIFKNSPISNFMKICPVGAETFHVDRQTDRKTGIKQ